MQVAAAGANVKLSKIRTEPEIGTDPGVLHI